MFLFNRYRQECRADDFPADPPVDVRDVAEHLVDVTLEVVQA